MSALQCLDCEAIFDERDAGEYTERLRSEHFGQIRHDHDTFLSCPECGSHEVEDFQGDDQESDFDFAAIEERSREQTRNEFTSFLIGIASDPWKKSA